TGPPPVTRPRPPSTRCRLFQRTGDGDDPSQAETRLPSRSSAKPSEGWRRERDSNPRNGSPFSGFQDRRLQPLGHLSAVLSYARSLSAMLTEKVCDLLNPALEYADWLESRQRGPAAATISKRASGAWRSWHGRIAK